MVKIAYKLKTNEDGIYKTITHKETRDMVNALGTMLISMGLKGKRIAVIGENRYEWEIAYLSIVCGTGIGVSIAANKVKGAYAACIHDVYQAQRAQLSNHANIITMGSQVIGIELAKQLVKEYLSVEWDPNCRSVAKVQRIIDFENEE